MIRVWACQVCRRAYEVGGSEDEVSGLLSKEIESYPCITPLCRGRVKRVCGSEQWASIKGYELEEIPIRSFFRAIMGFGKFDSAPAAAEEVKKILLAKKIIEVRADPVSNPERTILHHLIFEDGTVLHFGSSSHGACCYYIESVGPTCVEVFDREQTSMADTKTTAKSGDTDREEVGRAHERCFLPGG